MKISIITINYNNKEGLRKTIESVINQTFRDFEYIVIDGGSTDGSTEILKEYDEHITYWVSEPDKGVYNAMNKGILRATGELLNFLNSGDIYYTTDTLYSISNYDEDYDILVGRDYHYNEEKKKGFASILPTRLSMVTFFIETLPHQSAFFKRHLFTSQQYDETFRVCADWAFYINKIAKEGCNVHFIQQIVCQREQGGISNTAMQVVAKERQDYLSSILPIGVIKDYQTLSNLDKSTLYKLFSLCDNARYAKWLTYSIKIIHRISKYMYLLSHK